MRKQSTNTSSKSRVHWERLEEWVRQQVQQLIQAKDWVVDPISQE